jgi:hypothetical protein
MNSKTYSLISGIIFLIVGIVHLLRVLNDWPLSISDFSVPMWASWVGVVVAGYLAYYGLKKR